MDCFGFAGVALSLWDIVVAKGLFEMSDEAIGRFQVALCLFLVGSTV